MLRKEIRECNFNAFVENQPTNKQTDVRVNREVTLRIMPVHYDFISKDTSTDYSYLRHLLSAFLQYCNIYIMQYIFHDKRSTYLSYTEYLSVKNYGKPYTYVYQLLSSDGFLIQWMCSNTQLKSLLFLSGVFPYSLPHQYALYNYSWSDKDFGTPDRDKASMFYS